MLPCIRSIIGPITFSVIGVLEGISSVGIDMDFHFLALLLKSPLELILIVDGDSAILATKDSQNRRVDLAQRCWIGSKVAIVDHVRS